MSTGTRRLRTDRLTLRQPEPADLPAIAPPTAPAIILYTSGSTGQPKGAVLSHAALAAANESWAGPVMGLTEADRVIAALPLAHSFGLNGALLAPLERALVEDAPALARLRRRAVAGETWAVRAETLLALATGLVAEAGRAAAQAGD